MPIQSDLGNIVESDSRFQGFRDLPSDINPRWEIRIRLPVSTEDMKRLLRDQNIRVLWIRGDREFAPYLLRYRKGPEFGYIRVEPVLDYN